jgi:hypothetical protein
MVSRGSHSRKQGKTQDGTMGQVWHPPLWSCVMAGSDGAKEGCERGQTFFDRTSRMPAGLFQHCERLSLTRGAMRSTAICSLPTVKVPPIASDHLSLLYSLISHFISMESRAQLEVARNISHTCVFSSWSHQLLAKHCAHRSNLTLRLGTDIPPRLSQLLLQARPNVCFNSSDHVFCASVRSVVFSQSLLQARTVRG